METAYKGASDDDYKGGEGYYKYDEGEYEYAEGDYDYCTSPTECSHDQFFNSGNIIPLKESVDFQHKQNIKFCCAEHGYIFEDLCEVINCIFRKY